jgi:DNA-damage-inducible protein D
MINYASYVTGLEKIRQCTTDGIDYWMARDLMPLLDYDAWRNFRSVIEKARSACESGGSPASTHFVETGKMVTIGSGAEREMEDFFLSRYACYLIAMNSDSSKPEVGHAMTYFAVQTRRQELRDKQLSETEKRLELRLRLMENNHRLAGAAKKAGVKFYPGFQDAGHRGFYGMNVADLKTRRGLSPSDELLDRVGRLELSALDFRATLTEERLKRDGIKTEYRANETHRSVGQEVRAVMVRDNGVTPEDLPIEPSITPLVRKERKKIKDAKTRR